ncbi:hypothetical protein EDF62_3091 [Leucobacter luti]|uniref:Uncharacterized protein n=1 Tax=Leucobacter luti TaxID=340320 RepID=A0A4R6RSS0_9MICO|nr:hypothetical protein [Leucobacter luti]TDP89794.1 hypothetical protein EDF62_3091 [Leucobacter luti]
MTDPITSTIATQGAKSFGALADRLLGPAFEYWGDQFRATLERRESVKEVARRAMEKTNLDDDHAIPPRVAAEVFDKAQWAENEFLAEYLSGVLASARTKAGTNDAGVPWTALVGRLSSDQLALHWSVYAGFQHRFQGTDGDSFWETLHNQLVLGYTELYSAMKWPTQQGDRNRLYAAAYGLEREGLIENLSHGQGDYLGESVTYTRGRQYGEAKGYITFALTQAGISLFLQAVGLGQAAFSSVFDQDVTLAIEKIDDLPEYVECVTVNDFPPLDS